MAEYPIYAQSSRNVGDVPVRSKDVLIKSRAFAWILVNLGGAFVIENILSVKQSDRSSRKGFLLGGVVLIWVDES